MAVEPDLSQYPTLHSIVLTENEKGLFSIFLAALAASGRHDTVLRVAGGWVRDKLLGHESKDIDIAISNMTGAELGAIVNSYITSQGLPTHKMGIVEQNPEKSKHLETACIIVGEYDVDLVNLRAESYQDDSRIPSAITFGTPEEDALRRDFTVNALFFNIHTGKVEDFTKAGIEDLTAGLLRTPLDCALTFYDDPLRILRAVRFAKRLGFRLHSDMYRATADRELTKRLQIVSRQRYNKELFEILSGTNASHGLKGLADLRLFEEIFLFILSESMGIHIDACSVYEKAMELLTQYSGALQQLPAGPEAPYINALVPDVTAFSYLLSLLAITIALSETLVVSDAVNCNTATEVPSVSIAVAFIDEVMKKKTQTHKTMPVSGYIARICCASSNAVADAVLAAHKYKLALDAEELSPEKHILMFRGYTKQAVGLCLCTLLLSTQHEKVFSAYGLAAPANLMVLLDTKINVDVPRLSSLCGICDPKAFRLVKDAATLCYLRDAAVQESLRATGALNISFTFEYCQQNVASIKDILRTLRGCVSG